MEICAECEKEAVSKCAICGKPLCNDHITHGMSMRTNAPAANCANCQKNFPRKMKKNILIMAPILIVGAIILLVYLSTIIPFGL
ncbi:MAG: hypothetical protein CEE43_16100 [Promethearchaeota archaeon Loki_b32]|nr:MAG: hypothetical protein CEE43_16100 [Candidatus Lokiarchaeota archaeon Loki_b32]